MTSRLLSPHYSFYRIKNHLKHGGVIAYPTESGYGLGCLPQSQNALRRVIRLKKRHQSKGLITIAHNIKQLKLLIQPLTPEYQHYLAAVWPAAITFLIPAKKTVPLLLRGTNRHQIAVRIPEHTAARMLCQKLATPLISTSCNRAKQRPCKTARQVYHQFGSSVIILRGQCGQRKQPSSIIELTTGTQLR